MANDFRDKQMLAQALMNSRQGGLGQDMQGGPSMPPIGGAPLPPVGGQGFGQPPMDQGVPLPPGQPPQLGLAGNGAPLTPPGMPQMGGPIGPGGPAGPIGPGGPPMPPPGMGGDQPPPNIPPEMLAIMLQRLQQRGQ